MHVIASEKGVRREGNAGGGGRVGPGFFDEKPPEHFAREAARMAITLLAAVEAPAGPMPVVLAPGWPGILLHEAIGHGLEGDFNRKGLSAFSGRIGERVAAPGVTVVDDGTIADRRGWLNVDDEGNPTGRTVLIEDGILRGYLQDRLNSGLMGLAATGNGRREGYSSIPLPRMTNTFMLAGTEDPEDIVRSVPRGLYAKHFGGGQVDITSGKFVFSATEAYLIEDGRLGRARLRRDADRQRSGRAHEGHAHRPRPAARRGRRHLPEGRPERARRRRAADRARLRDHGRRDADLTPLPATSYSAAHQSPKRQVRTGGPRISSTTPVWMRSQRRLL